MGPGDIAAALEAGTLEYAEAGLARQGSCSCRQDGTVAMLADPVGSSRKVNVLGNFLMNHPDAPDVPFVNSHYIAGEPGQLVLTGDVRIRGCFLYRGRDGVLYVAPDGSWVPEMHEEEAAPVIASA